LAAPGEVPLWRRLLARLGFPTLLYWDSEHFKTPTPIYVAWCKHHDVYYLDYPHGYSGHLECPLCQELFREVVSKPPEAEAKTIFAESEK